MRRRLPLAVLILPVTFFAAISVMAFQRADLASGASVTVRSTTASKLSVLRVDTQIGSYVNNYLKLTFPVQPPNSTYTYNNVFQVLNRASAPITFRVISVTGEGAPVGAHLTIADANDGTVYWEDGASVSSKILDRFAVGGSCPCLVNLNVSIRVDAGTPLETTNGAPLTITVEGQY